MELDWILLWPRESSEPLRVYCCLSEEVKEATCGGEKTNKLSGVRRD